MTALNLSSQLAGWEWMLSKKQVPMEPDEENSEMDGWVVCPSCDEYIARPDSHEVTYCRCCGQAIKWEDEEDDE